MHLGNYQVSVELVQNENVTRTGVESPLTAEAALKLDEKGHKMVVVIKGSLE
jgi:hypothetical protein